MANKESLIIVLDTRANVDEAFKQKSFICAADLIKDKICGAKKDYISFVLLGTKRTDNDVQKQMEDGYENIIQYPHVQLSTWQLLINFYKAIKEESCESGEWLDALVVATEMLKNSQEIFKTQRLRILFFHDFNSNYNDYELFDVITRKVVEMEIELIVVSDKIMYVDNPFNDTPQAIFRSTKSKSQNQVENEKYALRLVSACNAKMCNFLEAQQCVLKVTNKKPWSWNSVLNIGTKIKINVSGVIAVKDESNIRLKKCWGTTEEHVAREFKLFNKGSEVELQPDTELIDGYMLGATPIAFDESWMEDRDQYAPGLKFLGFVKRGSIPTEYYCGDSLYWIVHRKGMTASAKKMDGLVKALLKTSMTILCWKIFSVKFNTPKIVVLIPNEIHPDQPATLSMIELSYHAQHHFWDFPTLATQKTECTPEQLQVIDDLIDSMNLLMEVKDPLEPRPTSQTDLLPFDTLPHIYEKNVMDILERKILSNASEDDEEFQEMLSDKNFVEVYWKVPEPMEERAKAAAKNVQRVFPLKMSTLAIEKAKVKIGLTAGASETQMIAKSNQKGSALIIDAVGDYTPSEDFVQLIRHNVLPISDKTLRDNKFNVYAQQMCAVLRRLIFESAQIETELEKIAAAMKIYRQNCMHFNTVIDYNKWISEIRTLIIEKKLYDFWRKVVVKDNLGHCVVGEVSLDEKVKVEEFYAINDDITEYLSDADNTVDTTREECCD